jgi:hypothetical protein
MDEQASEEKILADVCRYAKAYEISGMTPLDALTEALKLETIKIIRHVESEIGSKD